jgi:hypothetical protein
MGGVKALFAACALVGLALGIGASCGPERAFCPDPNSPFHGQDNTCINNSEAGSIGGNGGAGASRCPDGGSIQINPDNSCTCSVFAGTSYPCGPA